ncbi:hypothetical protein GGS24DRAFT_517799 [Hypoxylon argillaceum]|nr:hypothetical protein GGS24DRAFT_517799 [Hypoxylon argillaceum]KAI1148764.1 hypothetical protein F4825DRAFT_454175 [Nemania diffusa]
MEKFIVRRQSRPNQTRLVAIALGECDWLESERWELVPPKTIDPEHTVRLLKALCSILSRDKPEPNISSGSSRVSLNIGTSRQESRRSHTIRTAPALKLEKYRGCRQQIAEVLPNVASSGETGKSRSGNSPGRAAVESRAFEVQGGLLCKPEQSRERDSENGSPSIFATKQLGHARDFIVPLNDSVDTAIVKIDRVKFPDNEISEGGLPRPKSANKATKGPGSIPMGNKKRLEFGLKFHPNTIGDGKTNVGIDTVEGEVVGSMLSTQPTQPTAITDPSLANNDNEHHVRCPSVNTGLVASNDASIEEIYGVSEDCDLEIEDLPFTDDYWTWDEATQNYYHGTTNIQGHQVKIWYPSSFD